MSFHLFNRKSDMSDSKKFSKSRVRCREIMSKNMSTIEASVSLTDAAATLRDADVGILPIVDEDCVLIGIVTDRDIVVRGVAEGMLPSDTEVSAVMSKEIHTASPDDFVFEAVRIMGDEQIRRIPIVDDDNKLVGIVSIADVALEMEDEREIAETLEEISSGAAFWGKR